MDFPALAIDIEKETKNNYFYRRVVFTTERTQIVLMSLRPGIGIGKEVHNDGDQFIRIESGNGLAILNDNIIEIKDGSAIHIPAGIYHDIINNGNTRLQMYVVYTPPEHAPDTLELEGGYEI